MTATARKPLLPISDPRKSPIKANAFEVARNANCQLMPLFPYLGRGDIVPCCASFGSDGTPMNPGYFLHTNAVDELVVSFGSNGKSRTGDVFVGPRTHGVGGPMGGESFFAVLTITQRQRETGDQPEAFAFQCAKCNVELMREQLDGIERETELLPALPTTVMSAAGATRFNQSDELRTCKSCGHINPPFPLPIWGWSRYVRNTEIANRARRALGEVKV